jgi:hypothetical protein
MFGTKMMRLDDYTRVRHWQIHVWYIIISSGYVVATAFHLFSYTLHTWFPVKFTISQVAASPDFHVSMLVIFAATPSQLNLQQQIMGNLSSGRKQLCCMRMEKSVVRTTSISAIASRILQHWNHSQIEQICWLRSCCMMIYSKPDQIRMPDLNLWEPEWLCRALPFFWRLTIFQVIVINTEGPCQRSGEHDNSLLIYYPET